MRIMENKMEATKLLFISIGLREFPVLGSHLGVGTILGVPIIRTIVLGGLYWGPPI